jgi:hypothetical protein
MDSDSPPSRKRPRPRPVVSCLRCRDKKLKCDRATPCQNCIKAVCIAECTYTHHPVPNQSKSHDPANASLPKPKPQPLPKRVHLDVSEESDQRGQLDPPRNGIIEDLQRRVLHLEELAAIRLNATDLDPLRNATIQSPGLASALIIINLPSLALALTIFKASGEPNSFYYSFPRHVGDQRISLPLPWPE